MTYKGKYKQYKFENDFDRDNDHDPDFNLDEYILEKSREDSQLNNNAPAEAEDISQFKNAILFFIVFAAAFLWVNDWSVSQAWNNVFGDEEVSTSAPSFNLEIPEINIPDIPVPPLPTENSSIEYVNYLRALNEAGLTDIYSNSGNIALYQTGVPVDYLIQMNEAGYLDEFSYSAIIGFYNGGVTIEYLNSLNERNYIEPFSYSAIIAFYNSGVTVEYLDQLSENGLLENMSYSEVISTYLAGN